jgi:hypothetical protein
MVIASAKEIGKRGYSEFPTFVNVNATLASLGVFVNTA